MIVETSVKNQSISKVDMARPDLNKTLFNGLFLGQYNSYRRDLIQVLKLSHSNLGLITFTVWPECGISNSDGFIIRSHHTRNNLTIFEPLIFGTMKMYFYLKTLDLW